METTNVQQPQSGQGLNSDTTTNKFFEFFKEETQQDTPAVEPEVSNEVADENIEEGTPEVDNPVNEEETTIQESIEEPEDSEENFDKWDKEKAIRAYRNLQRKLTERDRLAKDLLREKLFLEEQIKTFKGNAPETVQPKDEPEPIPEPIELPPDFDYTEAFTNPHSKEAELLRKREEYFNRIGKFLRQELEIKKQQELAMKQKQWFISRAYQELNDPKEAEDMFNWFIEVIQKDDFKTLAQAYRISKGAAKSQAATKPTKQQQVSKVVPPAVNPGSNPEEDMGHVYNFDYSKIFDYFKR